MKLGPKTHLWDVQAVRECLARRAAAAASANAEKESNGKPIPRSARRRAQRTTKRST
jgi:hypothetical protein